MDAHILVNNVKCIRSILRGESVVVVKMCAEAKGNRGGFIR